MNLIPHLKTALSGIGLTLLILSCSEPIPNEHEQRYLDAVDSLKLYQTTSYLQKEIAANPKTQDLLDLSYADFKEKYNWNDEEMDVFSDIVQGHVSIAKTLESFHPVD